MFASTAKLALVTALLALFATDAEAQNIQRRCAKSEDPVKCTCFFSNNGQIINSGGARKAVIWSIAEVDGYNACLKRHGRSP